MKPRWTDVVPWGTVRVVGVSLVLSSWVGKMTWDYALDPVLAVAVGAICMIVFCAIAYYVDDWVGDIAREYREAKRRYLKEMADYDEWLRVEYNRMVEREKNEQR